MLVALASEGATDDEMTKIVTGLTNLSDGAMDRNEITETLGHARSRIEAEGFDARSAALANQLDTHEARKSALIIAAKVAWGGGVDDEERAALSRLAAAFSIDEAHLNSLISRAKAGS